MKYPYKTLLLFFLLCALFMTGIPAAAQEPQEEGVLVPVIMYHSLYRINANQWTITPEAFEEDLRYLSEEGYHAVGVSDLLAWVDEGKPLPEKPVLLTFDDGHYNSFLSAMPLLEKYDMKMVLSVIGDATDKWSEAGETDERYGHLTYDQINQMVQTGRVELSSHTNELHSKAGGRNGCRRKRGEDLGAYQDMLREDINKLQTKLLEHCGVAPVCFAYPFGSRCDEADAVLREMGFRMTLSCCEGNNRIMTGDADCLYNLRRNNRTPKKPVSAILQSLDK